jgi:hypothetical protein
MFATASTRTAEPPQFSFLLDDANLDVGIGSSPYFFFAVFFRSPFIIEIGWGAGGFDPNINTNS